MRNFRFLWMLAFVLACNAPAHKVDTHEQVETGSIPEKITPTVTYETFSLKNEVLDLPPEYVRIIPFLKQAADITDTIFQLQTYGPIENLLEGISDTTLQKLILINYGPYDRLNNQAPLLSGIEPKPPGANFYPKKITPAQFARLNDSHKTSPFTLLTRDEKGNLQVVPYHIAFQEYHKRISALLIQAADSLPGGPLQEYLYLRSDAFSRDEYGDSEYAWLDNFKEPVDMLIGPMETYEDQFLGYKSAYQAIIFIKNKQQADPIYFSSLVPEFQEKLPVPASYRPQVSVRPDVIEFYDLLYAKGLYNAGPKSVGLNFPSGTKKFPGKGVRRILFTNILTAKFEKIVKPLSQVLIDSTQRCYIQPEAFSRLSLFHEISHGLGIKRVIGEKTTLQESLKQYASILEEEKADIAGLYIINELLKDGRLSGQPMDYYVTFLASVIRSTRFGKTSDHGRGSMLIFNYFMDSGAFYYLAENQTYGVNQDLIPSATEELLKKILFTQGNGDFGNAAAWIRYEGRIKPTLEANLLRLDSAKVPVDLVFEQ
ncbi:MAG: Zn-dependent hydrolase [Bacteroidia bacterium]